MRVREEALNRGWVGMGWWVDEVLLGAYNNTTHQHHFIVEPYASTQKPWIAVGVCAGGGGVIVIYIYIDQ